MPRKKTKSRTKSKSNSRSKKATAKNNSKTCPPGMEKVNTNEDIICVGRCPHSGGPIYYNPTLDKLVCKWHGAQFTKKGKVLKPPAQSNLKVKKL